jgi:alpha-galactosidase
MLHDPLVGAVCNPPEVWQMVDEMLVAQSAWLPQYKGEIPKARKRLAAEKPLGLHTGNGAARLKVKTIDEMRKRREESRALADAADKSARARASKRATGKSKN